MARFLRVSPLALSVLAFVPLTAVAGPPSMTVVSPFYPPVYESPLPQPYFGSPYSQPGFMYSPGAQLTNPASNPYPMGAQTCVAPGYTCPAPAPNTPGLSCTCPTNQGGTVQGVVH
ncbi:MAG: hypothetical protein J2P47_12040 [Acetobacteraceae bacterium]|nr:hypothetical protein [Acetobacteraceae bacterium]